MMQSPAVQNPPRTSSDTTLTTLVEAFRRERMSANPALVDWQYVRHARNALEQRQLHQWNGEQSLLDWIRVMGANRSVETGLRLPPSLLDESNAWYERLFERLGQRCDATPLNLANALDFHVCSLLPNVRSVLDYGAGYGRQAFLFSRIPGARVFANDAVETSYFSQHWVFKTLGFPLWEYFDPSSALQEFLRGEEAKVIHLPTWRNDLIPDGSLNLVLFVWSLSEMSRDAALHALETCTKKLRPGGFVYIRDEPHSHGLWIEKQFIRQGFLPVFQMWTLSGDRNMSGAPRLYRYLPDYLNKRSTTYCSFLFTAWRTRTFSPKQLLVRLRRMLPF